MTKIQHATVWWAGAWPLAQHCQQDARVHRLAHRTREGSQSDGERAQLDKRCCLSRIIFFKQ